MKELLAMFLFTWLFDDLGGHPEGCAHEGVPFARRVRQLTRHPEIRQLHVTHITQQYISSLGTGQLMFRYRTIKFRYRTMKVQVWFI